MNEDIQHLKLLSIFHYIVGGLTALLSCMFILHVVMGIAMLNGALDGQNPPPPRVFAWFFILLPGLVMVGGWALSACMITAGRRLTQLRSRLFCLIIAGIECTLMPFGTVLGVFTIIVLMKDSVRQMFSQPPPPPYAKPGAAG
jgi:hypothetical protein